MINTLKNIYRYTYKKFFKKIDVELESLSEDCNSLLDVGCGTNSPIITFRRKIFSVGVDSFEPSIQESKRKKIHNDYKIMNVLEIEKSFTEKSFDLVIACDLIEHLTKDDGYKLMDQMEKIAKYKVVFYTPNGFLEQGDRFNNPWQVHHSGWSVEDFKARGYKVYGINGIKSLRGEFAKVKYRPKLIWNLISDLTEPFVYNKPENAFQLLAVKEI